MSSELRPAKEVVIRVHGYAPFSEAAAAVIEADREAVRAEQAAEVVRLRKLIEAASAHFLRLNVEHPIMWEGAIDAAMEAVCLEVERQAAELAKWKALAETLAGALGPFAAEWDKREFLAECHWSAYSGAAATLTSYKEQRDAS